jgi:hypothetical protein
MPRFVILRHELPAGSPRDSHWDLMFETQGTLRTWAVDADLSLSAEASARELPAHRLDYLDYEGPVSQGRGAVARWDRGEYHLVVDAEDQWIARLAGKRLAGTLTLMRAGPGQLWRVSFSAAPTSG